MSEDNIESSLNLSQRAYIIANSLRSSSYWLFALTTAIFIFSLLAIVSWYHTQASDKSGYYPLLLLILIFLSLVTSGYVMGWFLVKAPHAYKRIKKWNEDYLENTYVLIFDTTVPKGNTTAEKVLNLAKLVFPELRPDLYISPLDQPTASTFLSAVKNKFFRSKKFTLKQKISEQFDYPVNSYTLDLVVKTPVGYFIVKDFKDKVVPLNDLIHLTTIIRRKFRKNVFRIICVAKEYDQPFLDRDSLEREMVENLKTNFKIDLLIQEKVGYSVLWIT